MPETISYLEHGNGLVLHNGLPVKWVTNSGDLEFWGDYDIIIERYDCDIPGYNYNYKGFTVPYTGERLYYEPGYQREATWYNNEEIIQTKAKAQWGTEIAEIDGDIKMKTTLNKNCDVVTRTGSWASFTATEPKVPSEERTTKAACYMYPQSAGNHYFFGVKFGNDFGVANAPDITNHGKPCSAGGYAVIHKLYAPNCVSLDYALNASNYSAIKNVYAPNVTNSAWTSAGVTLEVVGSPRRNKPDDAYGYTIGVPCYYDNWFVPNLDYWCPIEISHSGTSSFNITARNYQDVNSRIRNISARGAFQINHCTADGFLSFPGNAGIHNSEISAALHTTGNITVNNSHLYSGISANTISDDGTDLYEVSANNLYAKNCTLHDPILLTGEFSGTNVSANSITANRISATSALSANTISANYVNADEGEFAYNKFTNIYVAPGGSAYLIASKNRTFSELDSAVLNVCSGMNVTANSVKLSSCFNTNVSGNGVNIHQRVSAALNLNVTGNSIDYIYRPGGNNPSASVINSVGTLNAAKSATFFGFYGNFSAGDEIDQFRTSGLCRFNAISSDHLERVFANYSHSAVGGRYDTNLTAYGTFHLGYNNVIRLPETFSGTIDLRNVTFVGTAHETNIYTKLTTAGFQTVYLPKEYSAQINYVYRSDGKSHYGNVQYV